jgi:Concanavalin A-like lectin/glucanases superfamily/Proprotein convertase P-domain
MIASTSSPTRLRACIVAVGSTLALGSVTIAADRPSRYTPSIHTSTVDGPPTQGGVAGAGCSGATLTQSLAPTLVEAENSVYCGDATSSAETSLARSFGVMPTTTAVTCVNFGVNANVGAPWPVEVRILSGSIAGTDNTQLLFATSVMIPSGTLNSLFTVDFPPVPLTAGTELVVELRTPTRFPNQGGDGGLLVLGCNNDGETAPTYIKATTCGVSDFITTASIGFPQSQVVMTVGAGPALTPCELVGPACCAKVCAADPFCCDPASWDGLCQQLLEALCFQSSECTGDGGILPDAVGSTPGVFMSTIVCDDPGVVSDMVVVLGGLSHTWVGDLEATLTHVPSGTTQFLFSRVGRTTPSGAGDNSDYLGDYGFKDGAPGDLWEAAIAAPPNGAVPSGTYNATGAFSPAPISLLTAFGGLSAAGPWVLTITDYAPADSGSLGGWSLTFGVSAPSVCCYLDVATQQMVCDDSAGMTAAICASLPGGTWVFNVPCNQNPCATALGACCFQDPNCAFPGCSITTASDCAQNYPNSTFHAGVLDCSTVGCGPAVPASTVPCVPAHTGLVGYWTFDELSGPDTTIVEDYATNGLHDLTISTPMPVVPGVGGGVGNSALRLDGVTPLVAPSSSLLDFKDSAFSFSAWIYIAEYDPSGGWNEIVDTFSGSLGLLLFVDNSGGLHLIREGTNPSTGLHDVAWESVLGCRLPLRQWTHVGFAVTRSAGPPYGGSVRMYIDGNQVYQSPNPSVPIDLSGSGPMKIGGGIDGMIDQIRVFRTDVGGFMKQQCDSGGVGYCLQSCYTTWEAPCDSNGTLLKQPGVVFCNFSSVPKTYNWSVSPTPVFSQFLCSTPLAWVMTPSGATSGVVTLPPRTCTLGGSAPSPLNLLVDCSWVPGVPFGTDPAHACWTVNVTPALPRVPFTCGGSAIMVPVGFNISGLFLAKQAIGAQPVDIAFFVKNTSGQAKTLPYQIVAMRSDMVEGGENPVAVGGLPPGIPFEGTLSLAPGQETVIGVDVQFDIPHPFVGYDVLLEVDEDLNGSFSAVASTGLLWAADPDPFAPCLGDLNADGVVDAADLASLLGAWGTAGADLDGNGMTDAADLSVLLGAWGGCP